MLPPRAFFYMISVFIIIPKLQMIVNLDKYIFLFLSFRHSKSNNIVHFSQISSSLMHFFNIYAPKYASFIRDYRKIL